MASCHEQERRVAHGRLAVDRRAQALVPLFLSLHEAGIGIAGLSYGLWLFPMGYLVFKSGFLPRTLGVLLVIAGAGHLTAFLSFSLLPDLDARINNFTWVGELTLPLWLVFKGVNVARWEQRALAARNARPK